MDSIVRQDGSAPPLTVRAISEVFRELQRQTERLALEPERWVVYMRPEVYSRLLPMRWRKLQPYIRKAWRQHG